MDVTPESERAALRDAQRSYKSTATEAMVEIHGRLPAGAMMKPVVQNNGYFTGKFLRIADPHPPGFIKGDVEGSESAQVAAAREFEEETFTKLPADRFVPVHGNIFKLEVTDREAKDILGNWKTQRKNGIGELVELKWMALSNVHRSKDMLNPESQAALDHLPTSGGRRTRRRMLKKPKTLKVRIR
jgi:hypothetical protein